MKEKLIFIILITISISVFSQESPIDLNNLPAYGNGFSKLNNSFEKSEKCILVFSEDFDREQYQKIVKRVSKWFLNKNTEIQYCASSEISTIDNNKSYLLIGIADKFLNLDRFNLPLGSNNGRISEDAILEKESDAIVIVNEKANCLALIGNSYQALEELSSRWLGFYDFYVLKDKKIRFFGNLQEGRISTNHTIDVELLRKRNYAQSINNEFVTAHFSYKYESINGFEQKLDSLNKLFIDFCQRYKVDMPNQKLEYYIHHDQIDINLVSGSPKPGTTGGYVVDGLVHSVGMDINLLVHEGIHHIFNAMQSHPNSFFNEGIPGSYSLFLNPENITKDCKLVLNHLSYDLEGLIVGDIDFWKAPYYKGSCLSYQFSGLFVKYLIDTYGIEKVKEFYGYSDVEKGIKRVFDCNLEQVTLVWKNWIKDKAK
ncbi:hypothetical protein [Marinifilum flexuosum]|uniref:hypothetical protein n=1 Tax=Marinifilum flexuosum TaxID=1117708 RepID=UPI0024952C78|nr:hypothetical protein [Marinifilum flexuosum]